MYELMNVDNLNAADMTHLLSDLGGGDMLEGIKNVWDDGAWTGLFLGYPAGFADGKRNGILLGAGVAAGVALAIGLCCRGIRKRKAKKQAEEEKLRASTAKRVCDPEEQENAREEE